MDSEVMRRLEQEMVKRYSERYKIHKYSPKTLGWDTKENMRKRFEAILSTTDFNNKIVLDIGCGFGDLLGTMMEKRIKIKDYIGWDINEDLLAEARRRFPGRRFEKKNILVDPYERAVADVSVMAGLLNLNLKDWGIDNYAYAQEMIRKAFETCTHTLIVDMLSSYTTPTYPKEDFVFYYEPEKMFTFAKSLTNHVVLKNDYAPIPQYEFMLVIRKVPA